MACLRGGWGGAELDTAGALAVTTAAGCPPSVAAALLRHFQAGMAAGQALAAERKKGDGDDNH